MSSGMCMETLLNELFIQVDDYMFKIEHLKYTGWSKGESFDTTGYQIMAISAKMYFGYKSINAPDDFINRVLFHFVHKYTLSNIDEINSDSFRQINYLAKGADSIDIGLYRQAICKYKKMQVFA